MKKDIIADSTRSSTTQKTNSASTTNSTTNQIGRKYIFDYLDQTTQLAIEAAKRGDIRILKMIWDQAPISAEEILKKEQLIINLEKKKLLSRRIELKTGQKNIIDMKVFLAGENVLQHIDGINTDLNSFMEELVVKWLSQDYSSNEDNNKGNREKRKNKVSEVLQKKELFTTTKKQYEQVKILTTATKADILQTEARLKREAVKLTEELATLEHQLKSIQDFLATTQKQRTITHEARKELCYQLIATLANDPSIPNFRNTQKDMKQEFTKIVNASPVNLLSLIDPETGNNLIHFASGAGQFETTLFLIQIGLNSKQPNKKNIVAIDTRDQQKGHTLLHHLADNNQFEQVIEYIEKGANYTIKNNLGLSICEVIAHGTSLVHFLTNKLTTASYEQKYLGLLQEIISSYLTLSHLLLKDQAGNTVYKILIEYANENAKECIFETFIKTHLDKEFDTKFAHDINCLIWQHFRELNNRAKPSKLMQLWLWGQDIDKIANDRLTFLHNLQTRLSMTKQDQSDFNLFQFLKQAAAQKQIPSEWSGSYQIYLNDYQGQLDYEKDKRKLTGTSTYSQLTLENVASLFLSAPTSSTSFMSSTYSSPLLSGANNLSPIITSSNGNKVRVIDPEEYEGFTPL